MQWSRDTISVYCYCAHDAEMRSSWLNVHPSLDVLKAVSTNWKIHTDTDPLFSYLFRVLPKLVARSTCSFSYKKYKQKGMKKDKI
jgi:hypothetical protein